MIVFSGDLSNNCKEFLLKDNAFCGFIISLISSLIGVAIVAAVALIFELWIVFIFLLPLLLMILLATLSPYLQREKTLKIITPSKIVFDGQTGYMRVFLKESEVIIKIPLSKVKSVIDEKEWYFIKFFFKLSGFICQKSLITEGTIQEFEKLFEDKIIRK